MAFANYIGPGTYACIGMLQYDKPASGVRFNLDVYTDSTKQTLVASRHFDIRGLETRRGVLAMDVSTPPTSPLQGDSYLVPSVAQGEWANYPLHMAVWGGAGWSYWYFATGEMLYNAADDSYYAYQVDGTGQGQFTKTVCFQDSRVWVKWFQPSVAIDASTTNIMKQIYLYLKTLPGFENVTDV